MRVAGYLAFWLFACGLAIWRGSGPERLGALAMLWLTGGVLLMRPLVTVEWNSMDTPVLLVDILGGFAWLAIALRANRFWPMVACAAQLITLTGHFSRELLASMDPAAYALMTRGPAYIQCLCLLIGSLADARFELGRKEWI